LLTAEVELHAGQMSFPTSDQPPQSNEVKAPNTSRKTTSPSLGSTAYAACNVERWAGLTTGLQTQQTKQQSTWLTMGS